MGFHTKDRIPECFQEIQHDGFMNVRSRERGRPVDGLKKWGRPKGWKEADVSRSGQQWFKIMKETWDNLAEFSESGGNNNNNNLLIEYELLHPGTVTLSLVLPNRSSLLYTPFTEKLGGSRPSAWLMSSEIKEALPCRSCVPPPARLAEKLRPSTSSASPSGWFVPQEICGWGGREKVES